MSHFLQQSSHLLKSPQPSNAMPAAGDLSVQAHKPTEGISLSNHNAILGWWTKNLTRDSWFRLCALHWSMCPLAVFTMTPKKTPKNDRYLQNSLESWPHYFSYSLEHLLKKCVSVCVWGGGTYMWHEAHMDVLTTSDVDPCFPPCLRSNLFFSTVCTRISGPFIHGPLKLQMWTLFHIY